jgi:hypothetical protein
MPLANLVSYHLLFVVLTIFSTLGLLSLRRGLSSAPAAAGAGVLWGLTSLVKPVALVIPVFVAPLMLLRLPKRPVTRSLVLMLVGMTLIIGPYVGRNYLITGQPIVTAQSGFAFWGTSIEKIDPGQPFLVWQPIWWKYGMPIFSGVTGSAEYSRPADECLRGPAQRRIFETGPAKYRRRTRHLLAQCLAQLHLLQSGYDGILEQIPGHAQQAPCSGAFGILDHFADGLATAGAIWGCVANDDDAMMVMMIYLGMVVAHSISFATERYAIAKLPLIILGFALLVRRLQALPRHGVPLARLTAGGAAGLGLLISALAVA